MITLDATTIDTYALVEAADASGIGAAGVPKFSVPQARQPYRDTDVVAMVDSMGAFGSGVSIDVTGSASELEGEAHDKGTTGAPLPRTAQTLASHRMRLLAKKYSVGQSPEELARLELLRHRIAALAPIVTARMVDNVENLIDSIAESREATADVFGRLGIK
jgi:hypothetical protein